MAFKQKRLLVDFLGYASMVPCFMLYRYLEESQPGYIAILLPFMCYLPIALIWHHYYGKLGES